MTQNVKTDRRVLQITLVSKSLYGYDDRRETIFVLVNNNPASIHLAESAAVKKFNLRHKRTNGTAKSCFYDKIGPATELRAANGL